MQKKNRWVGLFLLATLITLPALVKAQNVKDTFSNQLNRFGEALYYMDNYYLDTLSLEQLVNKAMQSLVEQLDPHSAYIPKDEVQAMNELLDGNFDGIGVEFAILRDSLVVVSPVAGGPSERVGIRAEDRIIKVDSMNVSSPELNNQKVYSLLRGPKGTRVGLTIARRGESQPLFFEVIRDKIPINSMDASYLLSDGVMYLKISRFALNTQEEFVNAFKGLTQKPKGIILDLQGNGGGYLGTALFLAEQFLKQGQQLLYIEGANMPRREEVASGNGFFQDVPVVVLIDENSASASEIVAGALQDWDRAVIVGRRSFGKGLVQQPFKMVDGAELRLTIARYHTPSGRVIQSPYKMGDKQAYYQEFVDRYVRGEYFSKDSMHVPDSLVFKTLTKGRTVYGGGGIMPDVFVPADTTYYSDFYNQLLRRALVTEFMNTYLDAHREELAKTYSTFEKFDEFYTLDKVPFQELLVFAATKELTPKEGELEASSYQMRVQLKALVASRLFDTGAFYKVMNPTIPAYAKAVEEMQKLIQ